MTFQFAVEELKDFPQNRVQQRCQSRSLTFQFAVEEFKVFVQDRVLQLHLQFLALRMRRFKVFFVLFPEEKKSGRQCGDDPAGGNFHAGRSSNGSCRSRRAPQLMDAGGL